jgi:hypothetical protein
VTIEDDLIDWLETMTDMAVEKRFKSAREALKLLQHPSYRQVSSLINPKKLPKPPHSSIRIAKHRDNLEINLPPKLSYLPMQLPSGLWRLSLLSLSLSPRFLPLL